MTEPSPHIRPATERDVAAMFDLIVDLAEYEKALDEVHSTPQMLADSLFPEADHPALWGHVAVDDSGEIVGMALWHLNYSTWEGKHGIYVEDLYVKPEHRGRGTGQRLLATLASICLERDYARLQLSVLDWNAPSIKFYEGCGGSPLSEWLGYRFEGPPLMKLAQAVST